MGSAIRNEIESDIQRACGDTVDDQFGKGGFEGIRDRAHGLEENGGERREMYLGHGVFFDLLRDLITTRDESIRDDGTSLRKIFNYKKRERDCLKMDVSMILDNYLAGS